MVICSPIEISHNLHNLHFHPEKMNENIIFFQLSSSSVHYHITLTLVDYHHISLSFSSSLQCLMRMWMNYKVRSCLFQKNLQNNSEKSELYQMSLPVIWRMIRTSSSFQRKPTHTKKLYIWKTIHVVTSLKGKPPDESVVILNKLTTDQVHVFGRNNGVFGCFSKSKFLCHVAIAQHFDFRQ